MTQPQLSWSDKVKTVKQYRSDLNKILSELEVLEQHKPVVIATMKLEEAIMWLGKELHFIGHTTPYTESLNPENDIVHPPAKELSNIVFTEHIPVDAVDNIKKRNMERRNFVAKPIGDELLTRPLTIHEAFKMLTESR